VTVWLRIAATMAPSRPGSTPPAANSRRYPGLLESYPCRTL